jgi:hypothetical protein
MPEKGETRHYLQRTDAEKRQILEEYDAAPHGEKSAVLARHWIWYSHIHFWHRKLK